MYYSSYVFREKNSVLVLCTHSYVAAAEAEAEAVAAIVTAAAGHTKPGPGQRRCACVSSINPLKIATCSSIFFFFSIYILKANNRVSI